MESEKRKDTLGIQIESGAPDESGEHKGGVLDVVTSSEQPQGDRRDTVVRAGLQVITELRPSTPFSHKLDRFPRGLICLLGL
jgi:hypothetical protein